MKFTTVLVTFALAIGLAIASPLVEHADNELTPLPRNAPEYTEGEVLPRQPAPEGEAGETGPVSKRQMPDPKMTLNLYRNKGCRGRVERHRLDGLHFNRCYFAKHNFRSANVEIFGFQGPFPNGAFVGSHCDSMFIVKFCHLASPSDLILLG